MKKLREEIFANLTLGKSLQISVRKVVMQISLQIFLIISSSSTCLFLVSISFDFQRQPNKIIYFTYHIPENTEI